MLPLVRSTDLVKFFDVGRFVADGVRNICAELEILWPRVRIQDGIE